MRRIPLHPDAIQLLDRYLRLVRCPDGLALMGSDGEREPLLVRIDPATAGRPLTPGVTARGIGKIVQRLGLAAAQQLRASVDKVSDLRRRDELLVAAQRLDAAAPHQHRHTLARRLLTQGAQLPEMQTSKVAFYCQRAGMRNPQINPGSGFICGVSWLWFERSLERLPA